MDKPKSKPSQPKRKKTEFFVPGVGAVMAFDLADVAKQLKKIEEDGDGNK